VLDKSCGKFFHRIYTPNERGAEKGRAASLCLKILPPARLASRSSPHLLCFELVVSRRKNRFLCFSFFSAIYSKTVKEKYFVLHFALESRVEVRRTSGMAVVPGY
jgi:hypothetical protein